MKLNKIFTLLPLLLLGSWLSASAQFKGGQADGYVKDCFNQTSSNLYSGGQGQGYNKGCYAQSITNIYAGGSADGADKNCYNQTSANIYAGGSNDGYSKGCYAQPNPLKPVVQFIASDSTICVGTCISFTDLSLYTPTSWTWTFVGANVITSNLQNPSNICYNTPGSYLVKLKATNALGTDSLIKTAYINVVANPTVTVTPSTQTICLGSGGNIDLSSSSNNMSYAWSPSTGLNTTIGAHVIASPTSNQTYNITATDTVYGCVVLKSAQVAVSGLPTISANAVNSTICQGSSTNLVANGGLTYTWTPSNGLNTTVGSVVIASPSSTQTYTVTGVNGNNCSSTAQVTVNVNAAPTINITNSNPTFCLGGSSNLSATGANTYSWSPSLGLNTANGANVIATPSTTTTYVVTGIGANSCSSTSSTVVTVNQLPNVGATALNNIVCAGNSTTLVASGANTYVWSPSATLSSSTGSSVTATPVANTTYTVIGTDANSCTNSANVSLSMGTVPVVSITSTGNTVCYGQSVTLQPSGASSYSWNPNSGVVGNNIFTFPVADISYTVTGYNAGVGCSSTATANIVVNQLPTAANITVVGGTTILCPGGTINLVANGAQQGASYQWQLNGVDIFNATASTLGATVAGTYTVIVGNANNCTINSSNSVTLQGASAAAANISANGPTTFCSGGSVLLTATSGSGLTYQWYKDGNQLTNETNQTYTANSSGFYSVAVTLNGLCTSTSNPTQVIVNPYPVATITPDGPTTFCPGSTVNLFANSGSNLSYNWYFNGNNLFNGAASINVSSAGTYTLYVTNGFNCTSNANVVINHLPAPAATATPAGATTLCSGQSVVIDANSGTGLSYQWYDGANPIQNQTNVSYTASNTGNYSVVVTNTNNCSASSNVVSVSVIANPTASISTNNPVAFCLGGSATLNANTGTGLTHQWQLNNVDINGATSSSYVATSTGSYTCKVTLNGNCFSISNAISVIVNTLPQASISPVGPIDICPGTSALLSANTGNGLSYAWYWNGFYTGITNSTYNASIAGNYSVSVTNTNNCTSSSNNVTINILPAPPANINALGNTTICPGNDVILSANTGSGITHQWNLNGNPISNATNSTYTASTSGNYTVTETGANTCTAISSAITVTVLSGPAATINHFTPLNFCEGGSVNLVANSGAGLTYQWYLNNNIINGATDQNYVASTAGNYTVQVTLNGNCSATSNPVAVVVNSNPVASITPSGATTFCSGSSVTLVGNSGSYQYTWYINGNNQFNNSPSLVAGSNGTYALTIQDLNTSCSGSTSIDITVNSLPTAEITPLGNTTICSNSQVILQATNAAGYSFQWKLNGNNINGANGQNYIANQAGNYTVSVTNSNNCSNISSAIALTVEAAPNAVISANGNTTFCSGGNVPISANTGAGLSYQWLLNNIPINGAHSSDLFPNSSGDYSCIVTLNGGCSDTSNVIAVNVNQAPAAAISYNGNTTFCSGNSLLLSATPGIGYTYEWFINNNTTGVTSINFNATNSGSYMVRVSDSNGCYTFSSALQITVNPVPNVNIGASGNTNICPGNTVTLIAPIDNNISYQWAVDGNNIPFATNNDLLVDAMGYYTVTALNSFNCSATSAATFVYVNGGSNAPIYASGPTSFCPGGSVILHTVHGQGLTYQWYYNGDPILNANDSIYTATQSGSFNVQVILDLNCTSVSGFINVDANGGTFATVMSNTSPINCTGDSVQLYTNTGIGYIYQWFLDGSPIVGADSSMQLAISDGFYSVSIDNGNGCSSVSAPVEVVLNDAPSNVVTFSGPNTYCAGGSVWAILENRPNSTYTWYYQGFNFQYFPILNYNNDSLLLSGSGNYYAVIQNGNCTVTTNGFSVHENALPTVSIETSGNTNICPGQTVTLTAHAHINSPFTYQWLFNGNLIPNAIDSTYMAGDAGDYTCIVSNASNCSITSSIINVYVNDGSSAVVSILTGSETICENESTTLIATHGQGLTHQWFYNGDPIIGANNFTYTADVSGFYNCQVVLDQNCTSVSNTIEIIVNSLPDTTLSNNQGSGYSADICNGGSVEISVPQAPNLSYQWYNNGNIITGANSNSYTATNAGNFTVNIENTVTGCSNSSVIFVVNTSSTIISDITAMGNTSICENNSVTLSALASSAYQYQWYVNGNTINGAISSSYSAGIAGNYTCVISNTGGCSAISNSIAVTVNSLPTIPVISGANSFCPDNITTLNAGSGYTSYLWNTNATTASIIVTQAGTYTVIVSNSNSCTNTSTVVIAPCINNVPPTQLRTIDCGKTNLTPNAQIGCNPVPNATNYEWEFRDTLTGALMGTAITNWHIVTTQQSNPVLQWNTQYDCRVRAKVGGLWGNFSVSCRIGLRENPAITGVPSTQLRPQFCNVSNLALSSVIACNQVSMVTYYSFEFTDLSTSQVILKQNLTNYLPLNTVVPSLQAGHNYQVRARAYVYNTWGDWGAACTIGIASIGANAREYLIEIDEEGIETIIEKEVSINSALTLNAYPNPFSVQGGFSVNGSDDLVMVYLYDALGNIVWQEQVKTNTYVQFAAEELASGMYLLSAVNKFGDSKSLRLIKTE
ncbi:MAG TPA: T9SS type A sorting domain-containing protein [Bacteroidia bacterium]|nr:T9SS type A sorting domain-containing protein [Bacteroidia bacterium]